MYPEIYDPAPILPTWTIMSRQQTVRMYHSVALLLPEATILVAGGGRPGAYGEDGKVAYKYLAHHQAEIFSPPYLFNADGTPATRPTITSNPPPPSTLTYGKSFNIGIGNFAAAQIQKVVLIRLPSVTHALNFDQRRVVLPYQVLDQQTLSVTAPANGIEAPPGPYMLFVLGPNDVPSVAQIITSLDNAASISFTDDPLIAGVTNIKAQHINELRAAVNAVRAKAGLAQASWTDPSLQGVAVKAVHIMELRQNLNQALQAMGFTPPVYTDSTLSPGVIVKKVHIEELRQALR
jgi:hypothetical protein